TPHPVRVIATDGHTMALDLPAGTAMARVEETLSQAPPLVALSQATDPLPVVEVESGLSVTGLPSPRSGVALVVSRITAFACPERRDLFFPYGEVRDDQGQIVGCRALGRVRISASAEKN
ncbi:MAG: hypothetical protein LBL55_08555, partial [Propionibacteriaceae bacterium]|nr:hypothetical protein [Propionibacteriaceae bacterium]